MSTDNILRLTVCFVFIALSAPAQTNSVRLAPGLEAISNSPAGVVQSRSIANPTSPQRVEVIRAACIQNRRRICGKILKILPDGLVVDSGYTNLMRFPLNGSWLVPGTAVAVRATNLLEANQAEAVCIGVVFLTDLPKTRGVKPRVYDYVNLEAFPTGQYTFISVGDLERTVRKFSTKLTEAVEWSIEESDKPRGAK